MNMTGKDYDFRVGDWEYFFADFDVRNSTASFQAGIGHDSGQMDLSVSDLVCLRDLINAFLLKVET